LAAALPLTAGFAVRLATVLATGLRFAEVFCLAEVLRFAEVFCLAEVLATGLPLLVFFTMVLGSRPGVSNRREAF
jgi:hypothetical protein